MIIESGFGKQLKTEVLDILKGSLQLPFKNTKINDVVLFWWLSLHHHSY